MKKKIYFLVLSALMLVTLFPMRSFAQEEQKHWAHEAISTLHSKGFLKGYADGSFKPDNKITRAEFIALINRMMKFEKTQEIVFHDVKEEDWFAKDIKIAYAQGYVKGYGDGSFMPRANLSRAQAALIISKIAKIDENSSKEVNFNDYDEIPSWAKKSVDMVVKSNYVSGYPDGSFKPNNEITRAEAFTLLHKVLTQQEAASDTVKPKSNPNDVIVEEDKSVVEKKIIKGDLIISENLGEGTASIKNVTVEGNLIIRGGGMHSVYMENVKVKGATIVEKANVRVQVSKNTSIPTLQIHAPSLITAKNFSGKLSHIIVSADADTFKAGEVVTLDAKAQKLTIDKKSNVVIEKSIKNIEILKTAADTQIQISKNAVVSQLDSQVKAGIKGNGRVEKITAKSKNLTIEKTLKQGSDKAISETPSGSGSSSNSGGSGSSNPPTPPSPAPQVKVQKIEFSPAGYDFDQDDQSSQIAVKYTPTEASNKEIIWKITGGKHRIALMNESNEGAKIKALDNGDYQIEISLKSNPQIKATFSGTISNQVVGLASNSLNLIAKDKEISGVQAGKSYILETDGKYFSVLRSGEIGIGFDTLDAAKVQSSALRDGTSEIIGLDNSKIYEVYEFDSNELFKKKLEAFGKYRNEEINAQNYEQVDSLFNELDGIIKENLEKFKNDNDQLQIWQAHSQTLQNYYETVKDKLRTIYEELEDYKKQIKALVDEIKTSQFTISEVRTKMKTIGELYNKLSPREKSAIETKLSLSDILDDIEAQIRRYHDLNAIDLSLDDFGVLKLSSAAPVDLGVILYKNSGQYNNRLKLDYGSDSISLLKLMRDGGIGTYYAELNYDKFKYFSNTLTKSSNKKNVEYLQELGNLEIKGETIKPDSTDKITFDFNEGILKWDSIPHAQYYDVTGQFDFSNSPLPLGKYYVTYEAQINNTSEFSPLVLNNKEEIEHLKLETYKDNQWPVFYDSGLHKRDSGDIRIAANLENKEGIKANSLSLSEFIPAIRNGATKSEDFHPYPDSEIYLDIYIIPRNLDGLFLTNTEDLRVRKSAFIVIPYKDYVSKFKFLIKAN